MHQFLKGTLAGALVAILAGSTAAHAASAPQPAEKKASPSPAAASTSEDEQTLYTLGVLLSRNIDAFNLSKQEFETVRRGFTDGYHHLPATKDAESHLPQVQALARDRVHKANDAYVAKAAAAPGATRTSSGLIYVQVKAGTGDTPKPSDRVKVNYEGRLIDGSVFDSSAQHGGAPAIFGVTGVIPCWTEALQMMKVGGKARIVCPSAIAYGERNVSPKIHPGSTLEFDIELLGIEAEAPKQEPKADAPALEAPKADSAKPSG
jgi:FKBP-type peptidyl-prolyl cis-trans isomerase